MTEFDRVQIAEHTFPDWREHLNDGKLIDQVLDRLAGREIVLNRCSRPSCENVARSGRKTCIECAAKAAQYIRTHRRRKAANVKKSMSADTDYEGRPIPH